MSKKRNTKKQGYEQGSLVHYDTSCHIDKNYVSKRAAENWDGIRLCEEMVPKSKITRKATEELEKIRALQDEFWTMLKKEKFPIQEYTEADRVRYSLGKLRSYSIPANCQVTINNLGLNEQYAYAGDPRFQLIANCLNRMENELEVQLAGLEKGDRGEEYVSEQLDLYREKYRFLRNIKLPYDDQKNSTSETDLYVLTKKGILVCEIKNKGNENVEFHIAKDGQWAKYNHNGRLLETMESPFAQNARHCIATEKFLEKHGITDYKIISVVIIGNENVVIKNEGTNSVIRAFELYNFIEGLDLPEKYDNEYQQKIQDLILEKHIKEESFFPLQVAPVNLKRMMVKDVANAFDLMTEVNRYINACEIAYRAEQNQLWEANARRKKEYRRFCVWTLIISGIVSFSLSFLNCMYWTYFNLPDKSPWEAVIEALIPEFLWEIFYVVDDLGLGAVSFILLWNALVWGVSWLIILIRKTNIYKD